MTGAVKENLQYVYVVGAIYNYEQIEFCTFKRREDARAYALDLANRFYAADKKFEDIQEAFEYERSEEWWDNDDRTVIVYDQVPVMLQYEKKR